MAFSSLDSTLTGPLFRTAEMAAIFSDRARLLAMLRVEAALARAQAQHSLVPAELADAIAVLSVDRLDFDALGHATALSGVPVIPFVKAVQKQLPPDLETYFHFGATTQDIADTALALQMRDALRLVAQDLASVIAALAIMAERYRATPCMGRTYLQHAAPVTFGFKIAARLAGLCELAAQLPELSATSLCVSLGGPVGTLTAFGEQGPAIVRAFARDLNLSAPVIAMHTQRVPMVSLATWLAALCGVLGAWGQDIVHLASTEVGEVSEPYVAGRGGSSAMPHKRNPVSATVLVAAATAAPGLAATALSTMAAVHERPAGAWHAEWTILPQLFGLVSGALREARVLADGLNVDEARMQANIALTRGLIFADAAAIALAPVRGRAAAYEAVEQASHTVRETGSDLRVVLLASARSSEERALIEGSFAIEPAMIAASQWVTPVCDRARALSENLSKLFGDA